MRADSITVSCAPSGFDVDWGEDYDIVLLTNFLHHFDRDTCIDLLSRARRALAIGGRVLAVEFVQNDDRVTPPIPAMFAYNFMVTTIRHLTQELDGFASRYANQIEHVYVDHRPLSEEIQSANEVLAGRIVGALKGEQPTVIVT